VNSIQSYLAGSCTCIHCSLGNSARIGERENALGCDCRMREWIRDANRYSYVISSRTQTSGLVRINLDGTCWDTILIHEWSGCQVLGQADESHSWSSSDLVQVSFSSIDCCNWYQLESVFEIKFFWSNQAWYPCGLVSIRLGSSWLSDCNWSCSRL
jgi:hypothetical protein